MTEQKFYSPLKIGLIVVIAAYLLFTFHGMVVNSWTNMNYFIGGHNLLLSIAVSVGDISAFVGIVFRLVASVAAFATIIVYFVKKGLRAQTTVKVLRVVLVCEAIFWLSFLGSGVLDIVYLPSSGRPLFSILNSLLTTDMPLLIESIAIPVVLLKLAYEIDLNKPLKGAIKWSLISGTIYVLMFWLVNTGIWVFTIQRKGLEYLTAYPQNMFSFAMTSFGLLALTVFTAYFARKSIRMRTGEELKLKPVGALVTALGLFFLLNYLMWIFFESNQIWSTWYAWFLWHNLDLWMMALPLVGLPLLFERKPSNLKC